MMEAMSTMLRVALFIVTFTACQCQHPGSHQDKGWCATGWKQNWEELTCVKFSSALKDRDEAPLYCQGMGSSLVSITNKDKLDFVRYHSTPRDLRIWINGPYRKWKWSPITNLVGNPKHECVKSGYLYSPFERVACDSQFFPICQRLIDESKPNMCSTGWVYYTERYEGLDVCLRGYYQSMTYAEAVAFCASVGGLLAMPTSRGKQRAMLMVILKPFQNETWVGIRASSYTGVLLYADGTQMQGCQVLKHGATKVTADVECTTRHDVACEKPMEFRKSWCHSPYNTLYYAEGKCVWFVQQYKNEKEASDFCIANQGSLVSIEDKRKLDFMTNPASNPSDKDFLIGSWYTDDDGPEKWFPARVLPEQHGTLCAAFEDELKWRDCNQKYPFICEKEYSRAHGCGGNNWRRFQVDHQYICLKSFNTPPLTYNAAVGWSHPLILAMPTSEEKYAAIKRLLQGILRRDSRVQDQQGYPYWIGMVQTGAGDIVLYSNGTQIPTCRWIGQNITGFSSYQDCSIQKYFICEKPIALYQDVLTCPDRWIFNWGDLTCVGYFLSSKTFPEAQDFCDSQRGKVMDVSSPRRKSFVTHSRRAPGRDYWVSESYDIPKTWSPVQLLTGKLPGNYCVTLLPGDNGLMKMDCQSKAYAVCEFTRHPPDCVYPETIYLDDNRDIYCLLSLEEHLMSYSEAASKCARKGGVLAMPKSVTKYDVIQHNRDISLASHWVGMSFSQSSRMLEYADGIEVSSCRAMKPFSQGIGDYETCNGKKLVTCETPMIGINSRPCRGEGWLPYHKEDTCIGFFDESKTWDQAVEACRDKEGWMVNVTDSDKAEFVNYRRQIRGKEYWTGWVYPEAPFIKEWTLVNISDAGVWSRCLVISHKMMEGEFCYRLNSFVCEIVVENYLDCNKTWQAFKDYTDGKDYCFIAVRQPKTFDDAVDYCKRTFNATVAVPTDVEKFHVITEAILPTYRSWSGIMPETIFPNVLLFNNRNITSKCKTILPHSLGFSRYRHCPYAREGYICEKHEDHTR